MKIVNEAEFNEITKQGITLVDFFANWCGPCKMLSPILEELDSEYPDITFVKVDCDADMNLADRFGIMSIPAIFILKDGEVIGNAGGYMPKINVKEFIDITLSKAK